MQPLSLPLVFLLFLAPSIISVKFDLATLTLKNLKLIGDAHWSNGSIHLSRDLPVPTSGAGRALYSNPIRFLHPVTQTLIPFSTFFSFTVTNLNPDSIGGGLAFIISSQNKAVGDGGGYLGVVNADNPNPITIAVEFDTLMDVPFNDINGNHVGVDLNSMVSASVADLDSVDISLKSGDLVNAWIEYSRKGLLQIFISYSTVKPSYPVINYNIDLAKYVQEFMYVGFSGSTQGSTEVHSIDWWTFSSFFNSPSSLPNLSPPPNLSSPPAVPSLPPPPSPPPAVQDAAASPTAVSPHSPSPCQSNGLCKHGPAAVASVATAGAFFIVGCAVAGVWIFTHKIHAIKRWSNMPLTSEAVNAPREFTYKELTTATRNFDTARIIGHGAFGTVYKGIIPETGAMVAVKRCIHNDSGIRSEFLSELTIIVSLRHRNLLKLQGWCHEKGEILLVYDYMLHGSLDKQLFEQTASVLSWRHRKKILIGVASALAYLHRECERQVIHRDVKSSNVMLDQGYNPKLGDFGLARQVDHDVSPEATVTAGTMGYLAPEYLLTGRATEQTDVFSFGAVVLEVICGKRPTEGPCNNLVQWVWSLHSENRILEAVDGRLIREFDEEEVMRVMMVGLACSSSDPRMRPSMRSVVQMLSGEKEPPLVPWAKPSMSFNTNQQLLMSLEDSGSDYNNGLGECSSEDDSLSGIIRGGAVGNGRR